MKKLHKKKTAMEMKEVPSASSQPASCTILTSSPAHVTESSGISVQYPDTISSVPDKPTGTSSADSMYIEQKVATSDTKDVSSHADTDETRVIPPPDHWAFNAGGGNETGGRDTNSWWTRALTLKLIDLYRNHKSLFKDRSFKKKTLWASVAKGLVKHPDLKGRKPFTAMQVSSKWKNLTKLYRDCIEDANSFGGILEKCQYFDQIATVYDYQPSKSQTAEEGDSFGDTLQADGKSVNPYTPILPSTLGSGGQYEVERDSSKSTGKGTVRYITIAPKRPADAKTALADFLSSRTHVVPPVKPVKQRKLTRTSDEAVKRRSFNRWSNRRMSNESLNKRMSNESINRRMSNGPLSRRMSNESLNRRTSTEPLTRDRVVDVIKEVVQMNEERNSQENAMLDKLEKMHAERMGALREFLGILKEYKNS